MNKSINIINKNNTARLIEIGQVFATKRGGKLFEVRNIINAGWSKSGYFVKDSIKVAEVGTESGTITHEYSPSQFASRFVL